MVDSVPYRFIPDNYQVYVPYQVLQHEVMRQLPAWWVIVDNGMGGQTAHRFNDQAAATEFASEFSADTGAVYGKYFPQVTCYKRTIALFGVNSNPDIYVIENNGSEDLSESEVQDLDLITEEYLEVLKQVLDFRYSQEVFAGVAEGELFPDKLYEQCRDLFCAEF